jgi:hypothetical protein
MRFLRISNTHKDIYESCIDSPEFSYKHVSNFIEQGGIIAPVPMTVDKCVEWINGYYDSEEHG